MVQVVRSRWQALAGGGVMLMAAACGGDRRPAAPPVSVAVAPVVMRAVPYEISAVGTVTALQTVAVRSQVGGVLEEVLFQEGDEVHAGQELFRIDPRPFQASLAQARATLERDVAQWRNARLQYDRSQQLAASDAVTQDQLDQARANAEAAQAAVDADSAALQQAQLNLAYTSIRATIGGRTGNLFVKAGNLVRTTDASPLVVVNQMRPMGVTLSVPQRYLPDIRRYGAQHRLVVRVSNPQDSSHTLEGTLAFLDNRVDTTTGAVTLRAVFANADEALWPGAYIAGRIELTVDQHAIVVPAPAVMNGQNGPYVFVLTAGRRVEPRPVTVGRTMSDDVVVERGLKPGDTVVTDGQLRLTPGAAVAVRTGDGHGGSAADPATQ